MSIHLNKSIAQNAYVVEDIEAGINRWAKLLGLGPFFVMKEVTVECHYRGRSSQMQLSVAMAQAGELNLELIQPLGDANSVYRDIYRAGEGGFHHISLFADQLGAEVERFENEGYEVALEGDMGAYKYCYVDTFSDLGCMIELVEDRPAIRAIYDKVREGALNWDGSDLIRPLIDN